MRTKRAKFVLAVSAAAGLAAIALAPAAARADVFKWDPAVSGGAALGGTGSWGAANAWWNDTGSAQATWSDGNDAVFEGTAGTVTLDAHRTVGAFNVNTAGYVFAVNGARTLTLNSFGGSALASSTFMPSTASNRTLTLKVAAEQSATYTGLLADNGAGKLSVAVNAAATDGILTLSSANAYSGTTALTQGVLRVGDDEALGTGALVLTNTNANWAISSDSGATRTLANPWEAGSTSSYNRPRTFGDGVNMGALIFTSTAPFAQSGGIWTVHNQLVRIDAAFTSSGGFSKAGTGALAFSGDTTCLPGSGSRVLVNAGSLWLNGASSIENNANNARHVEVADGATLGGAGTLTLLGTSTSTGLAVHGGGILAPGPLGGIGTFTVDLADPNTRLTLSSGATLAYDLGAAGGDLLKFLHFGTGKLTLNGNEIDFLVGGALAAGNHEYTLMEFYGDDGSTLTDAGKPTIGDLAIGTGLEAFESVSLDYSQTGKVVLTFTAVPEPATAALLAAGGLAMGAAAAARRRRRG